MTIKKIENFDEEERAKEILAKGFGQKIKKQDINILAKYFHDAGMSKNKLKAMLIKTCREKYLDFNDVIYQNTINEAVRQALKYPLRKHKDVYITNKELEIIKTFPLKYAKVLFIMLVYAKYGGFQIDRTGNIVFYCNYPIEYILGVAKIRMGYAEIWKTMLHSFAQQDLCHLIRGTEKLFSMRFVDMEGEPSIIVSDMNNVLDFFPPFCEKCGKVIEKTSNRQKYCENCWKERQKELNRENMRKSRLNK